MAKPVESTGLMSKIDKLMGKIAEANLARAQAFAAKFPDLKLAPCGVKGGAAMVAYHNKQTGWGFTVQFITAADGADHIHAFVEFVGPLSGSDVVANEIKKIIE